MSEDTKTEALHDNMKRLDTQAAMLGFGLSAVLSGLIAELINKGAISPNAVRDIVQTTREDFNREIGPIGAPLETALRMIEGAAHKPRGQA